MTVLGRIHHVGVACRDIHEMRAWVWATHVVTSDSGVVHDPLQRADLSLLGVESGSAIELVAGEMVQGVLKRGHSYYHLCYEVDSVARSIELLSEQGCRVVSPATPAVLFAGRSVAFLLGPMGLMELLEA
ncbi:MAG: hypothetical protein RLZZ362_2557 [Actinomycetota bacterium]|jgi:methylmalonyl-CoA/ethylmalonyl-CoA epimerase